MSRLIELLIYETGLMADDLVRIIATAPSRYKVFEIPKRSGGVREIAQPARELKLLQRIIADKVLSELPVHPAARAYRQGLSIRDNARPHAGRGPILKMDFKDFFPSIRSVDWEKYCEENSVLDPDDRRLSCLILFRRAKGEKALKLSIGAPSSPALSNILLYKFDELVAQEAEKRKITYTRYADDISFSGQRIGMLKDMTKAVETAIKKTQRPRLIINDEKTSFITAKNRRFITGVTLTNDGLLSLGRDKKRLISAKVHHASLNKLDRTQIVALSGQLAFVNVVEPAFLSKLKERYGRELIERIQRAGYFPRLLSDRAVWRRRQPEENSSEKNSNE